MLVCAHDSTIGSTNKYEIVSLRIVTSATALTARLLPRHKSVDVKDLHQHPPTISDGPMQQGRIDSRVGCDGLVA